MTYTYSVLIEKDEDGVFVAKVPDIPGCYTQGKSVEEAIARIKEAIELCLEDNAEKYAPMDFVGMQQVAVSV